MPSTSTRSRNGAGWPMFGGSVVVLSLLLTPPAAAHHADGIEGLLRLPLEQLLAQPVATQPLPASGAVPLPARPHGGRR